MPLDLWSKQAVQNAAYEAFPHFPYHWRYPVIEDSFHLIFRNNTGMAFSQLKDFPLVLVVVNSLLVLGLLVYVWRGALPKSENLCWGLIVGGALGNIIDRLINTTHDWAVRDFLDFFYRDAQGIEHHFATFNVADSAIFCGVVTMLLMSFRSTKPEKPRKALDGRGPAGQDESLWQTLLSRCL